MYLLSGVCGLRCESVTDRTIANMTARMNGQDVRLLTTGPLFKAQTAEPDMADRATPGQPSTCFASDDRFDVIFLGELYRCYNGGYFCAPATLHSTGLPGDDAGSPAGGVNHARLILDQVRHYRMETESETASESASASASKSESESDRAAARGRGRDPAGTDPSTPVLPDAILNHTDGIFIIVIFDREQQRVHFISDRLGLRYLYFHRQKGRLWWATESKAFLACPGFSPEISKEALDDFSRDNFIRGHKALLKNVTLMPPGTVRTFFIGEDRVADRTYWQWGHTSPHPSNPDEIAEHLASLLRTSVTRRMSASMQVGLGLGGGLDSRAILAAIPDPAGMYTFTFGRPDSPEIRVARTVAQKAGADFHFLEINRENWLEPRLPAVWWTDGQFNLVDMHGIEVMGNVTRHIGIQLNGGGRNFLGGYASSPGEGSYWLERLRRFQRMGTLIDDKLMVTRLPFYDYEMLDFLGSVPETLLRDNRMYHHMLVRQFPDFFRGIPYSNTGYPLDARFRRIRHLLFRVRRRLGLINYSLHDYPTWIPHKIAVFRHFLEDGGPRLHDLGYGDEIRRLLGRHQKLTLAECTDLCRFLTLEIYLRLLEDPEKAEYIGKKDSRH